MAASCCDAVSPKAARLIWTWRPQVLVLWDWYPCLMACPSTAAQAFRFCGSPASWDGSPIPGRPPGFHRAWRRDSPRTGWRYPAVPGHCRCPPPPRQFPVPRRSSAGHPRGIQGQVDRNSRGWPWFARCWCNSCGRAGHPHRSRSRRHIAGSWRRTGCTRYNIVHNTTGTGVYPDSLRFHPRKSAPRSGYRRWSRNPGSRHTSWNCLKG